MEPIVRITGVIVFVCSLAVMWVFLKAIFVGNDGEPGLLEKLFKKSVWQGLAAVAFMLYLLYCAVKPELTDEREGPGRKVIRYLSDIRNILCIIFAILLVANIFFIGLNCELNDQLMRKGKYAETEKSQEK
jgi:hypothetical protein